VELLGNQPQPKMKTIEHADAVTAAEGDAPARGPLDLDSTGHVLLTPAERIGFMIADTRARVHLGA
jgi:hypothetical protein